MKPEKTKSTVVMRHSVSDNVVELSRRSHISRHASVNFRPASANLSSTDSLQRVSLVDVGLSHSSKEEQSGVVVTAGEQAPNVYPHDTDDTLLVYHFQKLIQVSRDFVTSMEHDPDPYGIALSFSDTYRRMKDVYGDWARVVGDFIHSPVLPAKGEKLAYSLSTPGGRRRLSMTAYYSPKKAVTVTAGAKKLHLPDITIMPTQRVARYVMLFEGQDLNFGYRGHHTDIDGHSIWLDLLRNVPEDTFVSEAIHKALQMAQRLATLCNDRQDFTGVSRPLKN
ncbi:hypothetical protein QFC19_003078 [Naganishia cerealis]|uniref:Uncharacterized protein n=1 Tax=Naganishia cerealis TaxID=610337 RepID=A0ACC2W4T9_9TREE|nr:hypothetical protein QFC19_003078 [Naganishia cerealis]